MAKIFEGGDDDFPLSPYGHSAFLTSIRDFENEEGVKWSESGIRLGVEKVGNLFTTDNQKAQLVVEIATLETMPKLRHHVVVKNKKTGKQEHQREVDDLTGDERKKIVISDNVERGAIIPFFFNCGKPKEFTNETEITFFKKSSAYPLFSKALIESGDLPEDLNGRPFTTTQEELKDALEGYTFIGKCESIKGKMNYNRLIVVD